MFPPEYMTPMDKVLEVVFMLLDSDGKEQNVQSLGPQTPQVPLFGQTVEINCHDHHFRQQHDFCDEVIAALYK
jgi:hypothetical protein